MLVVPDINGICHIISEKQKLILNVPLCINSMSMKKQTKKDGSKQIQEIRNHGTSQGTSNKSSEGGSKERASA